MRALCRKRSVVVKAVGDTTRKTAKRGKALTSGTDISALLTTFELEPELELSNNSRGGISFINSSSTPFFIAYNSARTGNKFKQQTKFIGPSHHLLNLGSSSSLGGTICSLGNWACLVDQQTAAASAPSSPGLWLSFRSKPTSKSRNCRKARLQSTSLFNLTATDSGNLITILSLVVVAAVFEN
jgi:hypothetical protein